MAFDDSGKRDGEVGKRFDSVDLTGLDKRRDGRPVLRSSVVASEERVFAVQRNRPNGTLNRIGVDLDAAVGQENAKTIPVVGDVGKRFAERRLASNAGTVMREQVRMSAINGADRSCRPARLTSASRPLSSASIR